MLNTFELKKTHTESMPTSIWQNAGKGKALDSEIFDLCREITADEKCVDCYPIFLVANLSSTKKVIQTVEAICRRFLWTSDAAANKKALVAWENLCRAKGSRGLNLTNIYMEQSCHAEASIEFVQKEGQGLDTMGYII